NFAPSFAAWGALRPASEERSGQAAAGREFAAHHTPFGIDGFDNIMKNLVHGVFIKDAEIAIREEVHLQSFELEAFLARHVLDGDRAIVGHSGFWADGSIFGKARSDDVAGILVGPGIELRQFRFDARACVIGCVVGHNASYCTWFVDSEATATCRNGAHPLSSWQEDPPKAFDELPSLSSRSLPAFEAAVRFRISVQCCGCSSVAVHGLRDALPRACHTASPSFLCALRLLRQPRAAAYLSRQGFGSDVRAGTLAEVDGSAMRSLPA